MVTVVLLSMMLGAAPNEGAQPSAAHSLEAPPVADESPTAWSCTVDTLRAGKECVFEAQVTASEPNREQAANNVRLVQELGRALCAEAARPPSSEAKADKGLSGACEKRYSAATERCGLEGTVSLIDAKGRFAPAARACYQALSTVLQETQVKAAVDTVSAPLPKAEARSSRGSTSL
ncbi:hypothetical protein [Hyalangium rubrum]|uniref:Uncharacterized protein n=1 Tax=Hyalangium rubrum TaxID=3103134 RepID=A0ABU5HED0_9BACT|nr:hypothetical protein [Hyalangium sp. s54d21]MDY7231502.1 hypothetical protein [Hyalangium sp. s54d21]